MANSSSDNQSCFTVYDNDGFLAVVCVRAVLAGISLLCCIGMIGLIVLFKKYMFFTQRLILYLAIATLTYSIVSALNVEGYKAYRNDSIRSYCVFTGFLEQVTSWWVLLAVTNIMTDLFVKVMFQKVTERFELVYVLVTFGVPILIAFIPFIQLSYGPSGAWCWIRGNQYTDCNSFLLGTLLQFILYYMPLYGLMIALLVMLIIVFVKLRKQRMSWTGNFEPAVLEMRKKMSKEVFPLISYPIIFLVLNIFPLILRITNAAHPNEPVLALWFLSAAVFSLQGAVITLAFALDPETRQHLTIAHITAAIKRLGTKESSVEEYQIDQGPTEEPEVTASMYMENNDNM